MKFQHEFKSARWCEDTGKWEVQLFRHADGHVSDEYARSGHFIQLTPRKTIYDTADVVVKATGTLNKWQWPAIPGLHDFQGFLLHSARWDKSFDATGKTVAVIGNGSTGIQIVPALQPKAKRIHSYIRSKAWVSPTGPYAKMVMERGNDENCRFDRNRMIQHSDHRHEQFHTRNKSKRHSHKTLRSFSLSARRSKRSCIVAISASSPTPSHRPMHPHSSRLRCGRNWLSSPDSLSSCDPNGQWDARDSALLRDTSRLSYRTTSTS